ncbi:MAG: PH domain-containing protein [Pirellulaceae bacterium]|nr:PH domain-containing protein [Pirellulaceae bacterium]
MIGDQAILRASQWCYQGVWAGVTKWLCVPAAPPELVGAEDQQVRAFRPALGYLRYRKLYFWIGLFAVDITLVVAWLALLFARPIVGILLAPLFWFVIIVPDILVYIALHLRYDTTWYVLSDRTLRIRRGIWIINEVTITYENIQNVSIKQGPVQRLYGISDVVVQTAGGGGAVGQHGEQNLSGHTGLLEGIDNPEELRELIMAKWRTAKSAGLGDEYQRPMANAFMPHGLSTPAELELLQQIRDLAVRLAS